MMNIKTYDCSFIFQQKVSIFNNRKTRKVRCHRHRYRIQLIKRKSRAYGIRHFRGVYSQIRRLGAVLFRFVSQQKRSN